MKVFFDFEIPHLPDLGEYSPKVELIRGEIRDFVIQRFKIFEDEIERDEMEKENSGTSAFVAVLLTSKNAPGIQYYGYNNAIIEKMMASLTQQDMNFIFTKIASLLGL